MTTSPPSERTTFREVSAEILRRITEGPWGPGTLIPNEVDLAEEFGCSRTTMNRALQEVTQMGFLDRKRKAGTHVRMAPIRQARFEMPVVRREVEATNAIYTYKLLDKRIVAAPDWLCKRMKLKAGEKAVHVTCLHSADGAPFQLEDRWINGKALPQALDQDFAVMGPNEWLIETVPFSDVEISFMADLADDQVAAHLGVAVGDPVFCIERATWWKGAAITLVILKNPRDYRMTTRY